MKLELLSVTNFIVHLLKLNKCMIKEYKLYNFKQNLINILYQRYKHMWFTDKPNKYSAYRCLRNSNNHIDISICEATRKSGIREITFQKYFPSEILIWIDPGEVYFRMEKPEIYCLYDNNSEKEWTSHFDQIINTSNSTKYNNIGKCLYWLYK